MTMSFARHQTFHIRTGWLRKGMRSIDIEPHIFLEDTADAMDMLGIGKNMIEALRYWMKATKLAYEEYDNGIKVQKPTEIGELIYDKDEYFEDIGTFWIIHYNLCQNKEKATTWHWFFNHFRYNKFDENLFLSRLKNYIKRSGEDLPKDRSLRRDYRALIRTYEYDPESNISPENTYESPFTDLKLLIKDNSEYKFNSPNTNVLPIKVFYYMLKDYVGDDKSINIDELLNGLNSPGRILGLNQTDLYKFLEKLENKNYVIISKQAGLNNLKLDGTSKGEILEQYYKNKKAVIKHV